MTILAAHHIQKSFGAHDVLLDVNLALARGQRVGLVGPNGAGKTTLLHILAGSEEPGGGAVHRARGMSVGFLPQHASIELQGETSVYNTLREVFADLEHRAAQLRELELAMADPAQHDEVLEKYGRMVEQFEHDGGYTYETRIRQTLGGVGFDEEDFDKPVHILSGGQKTRVLLGRLILQAPDLLLLDEPTNHLDVSAVEWLEATLKDYDGSIVAVAHDRYFLDALAGHVWELDQGRIETYTGNYSKYLMLREERREQQLKEYERQQSFIEKEQEYIRRNMAGQNTRQAKGRLKRLERMTDDPDSKFRLTQKPKQRKSVRLNLAAQLRSGDIVLRAHDLIVGYQDDRKPLVQVEQLELFRGQRVALWGPNGVGKTTFLKTVLAEIPPLAGEVELGASVQVGYFSQTQDALDPARSIIDTLLSIENMPISKARSYLGRYLFSGDDAFKPIGTLSGGERARVALALLALRGANVLLLDEPTNHLDLDSQEVLQDVLSDFEGTMILVSHDRYLVNALATHVWAVEDVALRTYEGNYSDYIAQRAIERERRKDNAARESSQSKARPDKAVLMEARRREKRIAELEAEIDALELRLNDLSRQIEMATPDAVASLGQEYAQVERELQELVNEWSRVAETKNAE